MFQQVFASYFKVAESAIQFQHDLLRQWSGQWSMPSSSDGRTDQVFAMQKKATEDSSEMLDLQRKLLAMITTAENRFIEDAHRMARAAALTGRREGVDALTAISETRMAAPDEESEILEQAYLQWLEEGCPEGQDRRHYFEALAQAR